MKEVIIIGAGLAGSEACYQLAKRGIKVKLYEMRPTKMTSAHKTEGFGELVCSNSLRSNDIHSAVGLLKEEMRKMDSLIMRAADATKVAAGSALAVDRTLFSEYITNYLKDMDNVEIINEEITKIPTDSNQYVIIATGPLTSDLLHEEIKKIVGEHLYFFDAVAPIVLKKSINMDKAFLASRYDKGEAAYLNCPMNEEEFNQFYDYLIKAPSVTPKDFEMKVFEGCMPIEDMAKRGKQTLLFGPMKPVGLIDPRTNKRPYAVVQLRIDDAMETMYNLVGFQTHLKFPAQKELIHLIPGLELAEIIRYGVMHRNTYINSPQVLNVGYNLRSRPNIFFAGQITGVEGYVESSASGLIVGINVARLINNKPLLQLNSQTAIGSLASYVANPAVVNFVPMNANFGLFEEIDINKKNRKEERVKRALAEIDQLVLEI